jgi:hypothetical protein
VCTYREKLCNEVRNWLFCGDRNFWNFVYEVGFEVLKAVIMKNIIFWIITPCGLLKVNRSLGETYRPRLLGRISLTLLFFSAYPTLKMEEICSSETSIDF